VGLLAAGTAHEINNPLASVLANLDLALRHVEELGRERDNSERLTALREELSDARESSERIRQIVRDLKLFSRADEEQKAAVDVRRVLESSLRMAQNELKHRARLVKDYIPVPPVLGNESRLCQVFLNLLINAVQSMPEGHAEENEIGVSTGVDAAGRVQVSIRDTGSGMSQAVVKRLFTPFFTTKPVGVGTGLGLSICHRIVKTFGGDITVESTPGLGSTFNVHLPVAEAAVPAVRTAELVQRTIPEPARRGRVLVVDDEPMVSTALRRVLAEDHDVVELNKAQDALARVQVGERFDVIVSDLMMPAMTGMDLYEALQKSVPEQASKMIFLTGGAFTARARTFLDTVPNLRIEKPFDAAILCGIVNERIR
jgi:CheY-like chemotaxis protein